jgi:hypothetical protein
LEGSNWRIYKIRNNDTGTEEMRLFESGTLVKTLVLKEGD